MLHVSTVKPSTLALLNQLMSISELASFALVGGTALSLRYGHRQSIDLDLFSSEPFDNESIVEILNRNFPSSLSVVSTNPIGVFAYISEVKVDFVNYSRYSLIDEVELCDAIRLLSDKDLIAMKINAIMRRAAKKDFWDIAELLQHYSVGNFIDYYTEKYPKQQFLITVPRAISYFDDADASDDPVSLKGQTWESVKEFISQKVRDYLA